MFAFPSTGSIPSRRRRHTDSSVCGASSTRPPPEPLGPSAAVEEPSAKRRDEVTQQAGERTAATLVPRGRRYLVLVVDFPRGVL